jgi:hypothetical protein
MPTKHQKEIISLIANGARILIRKNHKGWYIHELHGKNLASSPMVIRSDVSKAIQRWLKSRVIFD